MVTAPSAAPPDREPPVPGLWRKSGRVLVRTARFVILGALSLWALYLVVLNVALATPLFGKLVNADPETLLIQYDRAWTILPGRVHAHGLSIRSVDSKVEFLLTLDHVTFDASLPLLAAKRFVVTRARGSGVTFLGRTRQPSPRATPEYLDQLPVIPGLGRMPLATQKPPGEDVWNDDAWSLVTVHLEDTVAEDVREVWIDDLAIRGPMKVSGGFFLKPVRTARIGPIDLTLEGASVRLKGRQLAEGVRGQSSVRIAPFDPRAPDLDVLATSRIETDLVGRVSDLGAIPELDGRVSGAIDVTRLRLRDDMGRIDADVEAAAPALALALPGAPVTASASASARLRVAGLQAFGADRDVPPGDLDAEVEVTDGRVHAERGGANGSALADVAHARLHVSSKEVRVRDPLHDGAFEIALRDVRVKDAAAWSDLLPAGLRVAAAPEGARVEASAQGTVRDGVVKATAKADGHGLAVAKDDARVAANVEAALTGTFAVTDRVLDGRADVVIADVDANVGGGRMTVKRLDTTAVFHRLAVDAPTLDALDLHVVSTGAEVPDARTLNALVGKPGTLSFDRGRATASLGLDLRTTAEGRKAEGTARLAVQGGLLHVRGLRVLGDFGVDALLRGVDAKTRALVLDGSRASLKNLHIEGGADVPAFSAEVRVPHGRLLTRGPARMQAAVVVEASDAGPVLDAVAPDLPGLVVSALSGTTLAATASVDLGKGGVRVDEIDARAGAVRVRGSYATRGEQGRGAVVVEMGAFSAGIGLGEDGGLKVGDLHPWFEDQQRAAAKLGPKPAPAEGSAKAKR